MKKKFVLDTYALLAYLKQEQGHEKVRQLLVSANTEVFMNDINIGETYYIISRARGLEDAEYFLSAVLPSLSLERVSNDLDDVIEAAKIKAQFPISYADCFVIATARKTNATIVSGDPDFNLVQKIVPIQWI